MKSFEREVHLQTCEFWLCGHCFQKMPATGQYTHRKVCRYWRCRYCARKLLRAEALSHKQTCDFIVCHSCSIRIQDKDILSHICKRRLCGRCQRIIPLDDYDHHQATCSYIPCLKCYARMPLAALADHKVTCAGPLYLFTAKHQPDDYATALRAIFNPKQAFPLTPSVFRVMKAWTKNPYTTIIVDFEYDTYILNTLKHEGVFQIAAANALGEWIVPPTSINHGMSTLEFFKKLESNHLKPRANNNTLRASFWKKQFALHYGAVDDLPTQGISWGEIGGMIDSYTKVSKPTLF